MVDITNNFETFQKQIKTFNRFKALLFVVLFSLFLSCNKDDPNEELITDIDGNIYHTVVIGNQKWMLENLKTTKYNDGEEIPNVQENEEWEAINSGAFCNYNNLKTNGELYGKLYNWYAINTGKLAPQGWRVATDNDWTLLTDYLGGLDVSGGKIKEAGTLHWDEPNTGATNSSGFTALPGGMRYFDGYFTVLNRGAVWWTSTAKNESYAWFRSIGCDIESVRRDIYGFKSGFLVRCIKEE
ncbi:MAG: fibrobacter succinogenes major paralogous domain-containing protein [Bacteroidota bacterium]|nr:fibrobacter succinogenes major paralogous domain-containing protein [Bacteroidota bacterium]